MRAIWPATWNAPRPVDSIWLGEALNLQAEAMWRGGRVNVAEAESVAARAVAVRERVLGSDHLDYATSLHNQSNLLRIGGRLDQLDERYRRVLAIRLAQLGPEHPDVARTLNDYGNLLNLTGDYSGAESLYVRACATYERLIETQRRNVGACLNNLAQLALAKGDYARARALQERSLEEFTAALGPDHANVAVACVNLARTLSILGERDEALRLLERAFDIHVKTLGPEHADVAWNLRELGSLQTRSGNLPEARRSLERAIEIHEKSRGERHTETALDLSALADVAEATGRDSEAVALHERALAINRQVLGPQHPRVALELMGLGRLATRRGDFEDARREFEQSLAIRRSSLGADHPLVAEAERALANVVWAMGDTAAAFEMALSAEAIAREHVRLLQQSLPERLALSFAGRRITGLDLAVSIYLAGPSEARAVRLADAIVRSRAIVLDEMVLRARLMAEMNEPGLDTLARRLSAARERLSNLSVRMPEREQVGRYRTLVDAARADRERAERAFAEASLAFRGRERQRTAGFEEVRSALTAGSTLVGYWVVRRTTPGAADARGGGGISEPPGKTLYIACVIRSGDVAPIIVPLAAAPSVDSLASLAASQLAAGSTLPVWRLVEAEGEYRLAGAALRRAVWDPLEPHLGTGERVLIVPDGGLSRVDFVALPDSTGYLVEGARLFHYLSSERALASMPASDLAGRGLLVVGDPDFGAQPGSNSGEEPDSKPTLRGAGFARGTPTCIDRLPVFAPLPRARREARVIEGYWERLARHPDATHGGTSAGDTAIVLTGRLATEDAFRRLAPGRRVLHLATHGFVLEDRCADDSEAGNARPPAHPATLGGLALTDANRRSGPPTRHDGVLTAEEIAGLDLGGVEWTVLSACNTGVGEVRYGEGVFGLRRAFEVAGCHTLVMSLWPVSDEAAGEWMERLYEARFSRHLDTASALRAAGRGVLERRRSRRESTHPWCWAGFIAAGDWR